MMRSLSAKLTIAFLVVGLTGSIIAALLVQFQTRREIDRFVLDLYQTELVNQLIEYYEVNGSWRGLEGQIVLRQPGPDSGRSRYIPVTVTDAAGRVILGRPDIVGKVIEIERRRSLPLVTGGQTVGWIMLYDEGPDRNPGSPEGDFLARMNLAIRVSAMTASVVALVIGVLLARTISRPIRDLQEATKRVATGELGYQVPVRTKDDLGQLTASFNQMSADLAHENNLRRQMTADIAHELRNPLSVILGYTESLSEGKLKGSEPIFAVMNDEALHLRRLIDDLRTLSLAEAGELTLYRQDVEPRSLLERVLAAHAPRAEERSITLEIDASETLPRVSIDPDRIAQVLGNLVTNALRYTPAGGSIRLSAYHEAGRTIFRVADTGSGIQPKDLPYIFERFYRADRARSSDSGESGLGLAIARSIVKEHGGTINVESTPGQGTTFTVTL
ncbi:MAG: HAMP domain-containing histidine kinase [Anaerolineae bacterium]|nr:HAMP domain-containing histidine kinase [Anaerolineae bacterium]